MTTRRQFLKGAVAIAAATAVVPLVASLVEQGNVTRVLTDYLSPGDVITIEGRTVPGSSRLQQFVVVRVDASGAELSIADHAGKTRSIPAHRAQPWPRHHKRDRWA